SDGYVTSDKIRRFKILVNLAFSTTGLTLPNRVTATLMVNTSVSSGGGSQSMVLDNVGNTFLNMTTSIINGGPTVQYWIRLTSQQQQPITILSDPRSFIEIMEIV